MLGWNRPVIRELDAESLGLEWRVHDEEQPAHHLYKGDRYIGEVYGVEREGGDQFRWHNKISDFRDFGETFDEAKRAMLADYVRYISYFGDEL